MWIAQGRGRFGSRTHATLDPIADAEEYWDFNIETVALNDIPATVDLIINVIAGQNGNPDEKIQLIGFSSGAAENLIFMQEQADFANAKISNAVQIVTCAIPRFEASTESVGLTPVIVPRVLSSVEDGPEGRDLSHYYYCDKSPYYAKFNEVKSELTYSEYREFYHLFMQWRYEGDNWWVCDDRVFDAINDALCQVQPSNSDCQPESIRLLCEQQDNFKQVGAFEVFGGDNWATQLDDFCALLGEDSFDCQYYRAVDVSRPFGSDPTGLQYTAHIAQLGYNQQFVRYNPDFCTNGWFTEPEVFGTDNIAVPIRNQYVKDDEYCSEVVNQGVTDTISSVVKDTVWKDGRGHVSILGRADEGSFEQMLSDLLSEPELVA